MTKEELQHRTSIQTAYLEGQPIQVRYRNEFNLKWMDSPNPSFDWESYDYRIKPEPDSVPYKDAYEFMKALINHSGDLILKDSSGRARSIEQIDFTDNTVKISTSLIRPQDDSQWYGLNVVLESFTFTDDAKCGCLNNSTKI